ncbi:hypothetical protein [Cytobacillus horneckiae]|uniref:Uncharacterized protein n=1 Tax=Cytobacillus horneckiae TaxID=549687 RepID=A0A2N0ZB06_9BACI|nr:hypothetical protein [Cytobacillus horneckiae]MEC1158704.1 hypothetical protein [Cytobacillus horneckiae]NRG46662.1 hypothetical protein [Bacillus sp. CRN 9]PKG26686.1 hypothetical protein CWS20_22830 [Cytobacillus horneckiae]
MFRILLKVIFMIFIIAVVGSILLEQFPQLQPLWSEFKDIISNLYESSKVKYGTIATVVIIIGICILVGTSNPKV